MTTVKHPHSKSNAAKIRKLILQGELSNKVIADKVHCPIAYVYAVRMNMKKKVGIANLPSVTDVAPPSADFMFAMSQGKRGPGRPPKNPYPTTYLPEQELAAALSKVQDGIVERKHLKQSFFAIVAMALLLAAVLAYTFTK
jgi:hypothetical protein